MKKVTIRDVAKECKVSAQTVSRVINDDKKVKKETRELILNMIEKLEYRPNLYAKNLSRKKNKNILISMRRIPGLAATIWTNILVNEIFIGNKNKNTSIIIEQYYNDEELKNSLLYTSNTFVDGVIIFYEKENDKRIEILKKEKIPFIIVGKSYSKEHIYVSCDDYNTTFRGIEFLFEKNNKKINFITGDPTPLNLERKRGVIEAYKKNNINLENLVINEKMNIQDEIYKLIEKICIKKELPDAFFVSGDEKAITVLKALNDYKVKIPEEVSVLGLDNIPISKYLYPSLTTLGIDYKKMANCIHEKLENLMNGLVETSTEIPCEIIIRESVK